VARAPQPREVTIYGTRALEAPSSSRIASALSIGAGGAPILWDPADHEVDLLAPGAGFFAPPIHHVYRKLRATQVPYYYVDHAYFGRGEYFRITRGAKQHLGIGPSMPRRLDRFGVKIRGWKRGGRHVLICPPDDAFARLNGFTERGWTRSIAHKLGQHTDRELRVRSRLPDGEPRPLQLDLYNCHALVTYVSNAAVEAVLHGVPVFCVGPCAALTMGRSQLSQIEEPFYPPGRRLWAEVLASNQWTLDEMRSGFAWTWLIDMNQEGETYG